MIYIKIGILFPIVTPYKAINRSMLTQNNGNLPLLLFGANELIVLLDNIY